MGLTEELQKLHQLRVDGAITEAEFIAAKSRLIYQEQNPEPGAAAPSPQPTTTADETRQWAVFLHLSQFLGVVFPVAGLAAPVVIWQLKKNELPAIDAHGKVVMNWLVSFFIYTLGAVVLSFLIVGIPILLVLAALAVIFPVMGAMKADKGELWPYPLSIRFFT